FLMFFSFFFFFSSRRRHTRSLRDWSSDVCSSDLRQPQPIQLLPLSCRVGWCYGYHQFHSRDWTNDVAGSDSGGCALNVMMNFPRSEERRVGKECRSRWTP